MTTLDVRTYWEDRYAAGGDSGAGSRGELARRKADFLNRFTRDERIGSVVELGCGDGAQLALMSFPSYTGLDVSPTAIARSARRFGDDHTKRFLVYDPATYDAGRGTFLSDLALSLDVIYHLVDDSSFEHYMHHLFVSATRYVIIYSTNVDEVLRGQSPHVRHRKFTRWIARACGSWALARRVPVRTDRTRRDPDFFVFAPR